MVTRIYALIPCRFVIGFYDFYDRLFPTMCTVIRGSFWTKRKNIIQRAKGERILGGEKMAAFLALRRVVHNIDFDDERMVFQ